METVVWDDALEERIAETLVRRYEITYGRKITNAKHDTYKSFELGTVRLVLTVLAQCGLIEKEKEHGTNHGH